MQKKFGNMIDAIEPGNGVWLCTTNSYIRKDGALVMGRGCAKAMAEAFPGLPMMLGARIEHLSEYNIGILEDETSNIALGAFQVKYHFKQDADLGLIERSCSALWALADLKPEREFHLNYPGIGNGRLKASDIEPLIQLLPDNVNVWQFAKEVSHHAGSRVH